MKKLTAIFILICLIFPCFTAFAEDVAEKYTVTYYLNSNEEFFSTTLMTKTSSTLHGIIREIPKREGYVFQGWRNSQTNEIFQPNQSIKIFGSTDFFAQWRRENAKILSFVDGGKEIIPRQIVLGDTATISELVPKRVGKTFVGWSAPGMDAVLKPGQKWEVSRDTVLEAVWASGGLPSLDLKVDAKDSEQVMFSLDFAYSGAMAYENYIVVSQNLSTGEIRDYEITDGSILINGLPSGPYKARLVAKKYGVEYFGEWVNFAVLSGKVVPNNPLKLILDGKELIFSETPPALVGGHTYIALRHFCESMGARVEWSDETRCATITLGETVIKLFDESRKCVVNGTVLHLPAQTIIMGSRMMLPLRSVAELCNAEIIWDENRTVYIFSQQEDLFEENMVYIQSSKGEYLGTSDGQTVVRLDGDFECAWIFDAVDKTKGIFEIYSLSDLSKPLQVKDSEAEWGQGIVIDEKSQYDGHFWKIIKNKEGSFRIAPVSNLQFSLDVENLCLTADEVCVDIFHVGNR